MKVIDSAVRQSTIVLLICVGVAALSCHRPKHKPARNAASPSPTASASPSPTATASASPSPTLAATPALAVRSAAPRPTASSTASPKPREVYAAWYDVPVHSLAQRRAGKDELTAAHNTLRIGTLVRVTKLSNGKSVVVRITDRGITSRRAKIDVCRRAAEQLDMLGEGLARVRLEILSDKAVADPAPAAP